MTVASVSAIQPWKVFFLVSSLIMIPNGLPGRLSILSQINRPCHLVSLCSALKSPFDEVSRDCHDAAQLNLAATDYSCERGAVELSLVGPGEFVAALLQGKLLLSNAALIPDGHCPRSLDRHRGAGWEHRIFI